MNNYKKAKHYLWMYLGRSQRGLRMLSLYCSILNKRNVIVDKNTELVIEGYPRSANTFTYAAFIISNGQSIKVAHHVHASAQYLKAVELGIPAILLIRHPLDAVVSLILRAPYISPKRALKDYLYFHNSLYKVASNLVVVDFKYAIVNTDNVFRYVNSAYGKSFSIPNLNEQLDDIKAYVEFMDKRERNSDEVDVLTVAVPTKMKKEYASNLKEKLMAENSDLIDQCVSIYGRLMEYTPFNHTCDANSSNN
jgi:hypothetical protein